MKKSILAFVVIALAIGLSFTYFGRYIFWNFADIGDYRRFPSVIVQKGGKIFSFNETASKTEPGIPSSYLTPEDARDFDQFMREQQTVAFIVIQNDTLLTEKYYDGFSRKSIIPVFSVVKSVVSALAGIAIDEGAVHSVDEPVTNYVKGFRHEGFEQITLEHLLNMRSGISYSEEYFNPFSEMARFYYGKNLDRYVYNSRIKEDPDLHYDYISVNAQIVAMIIENATGKSIPVYLSEKLWSRIGMEYDASWSLDSEKNRRVKAFCCLNVRPLDLAKFARLYLHQGQWEGEQVISSEWVRKSISITNDSRDSGGYPYHYFWRVLEDGSYFAKGILGQYLYVDPSRQLIMLRLGKKAGEVDWINFFREYVKEM